MREWHQTPNVLYCLSSPLTPPGAGGRSAAEHRELGRVRGALECEPAVVAARGGACTSVQRCWRFSHKMVLLACIVEVKTPTCFCEISSTALTAAAADVPDPDGPPGRGGGGCGLGLPRSCEVGAGARPPPGVLGCCQFSGVVRFHGLDVNLVVIS